jgi:chaperonin GroEL (HSP60 family)
MAIDRDRPQRASEHLVERDRRAAHDAMAQVAWTKGYLYGMGMPKIARALAVERALEKIQRRRAAQQVTRALDRNRKRILENIR